MAQQNRKPPAFQEYAASTLANRQFRLMTLSERGLYYTLRLECWENQRVPSSVPVLAKYLGCEVSEIESSLTENVRSFFVDENGSFSCPELDDYRKYLDDVKARQIEGAKRGASITNAKLKKSNKPVIADDTGRVAGGATVKSQVGRRSSVASLVKLSTVQLSQEQSLSNGINNFDWVNDYDESEDLADTSYQKVRG